MTRPSPVAARREGARSGAGGHRCGDRCEAGVAGPGGRERRPGLLCARAPLRVRREAAEKRDLLRGAHGICNVCGERGYEVPAVTGGAHHGDEGLSDSSEDEGNESMEDEDHEDEDDEKRKKKKEEEGEEEEGEKAKEEQEEGSGGDMEARNRATGACDRAMDCECHIHPQSSNSSIDLSDHNSSN
ncbi:hypothetical protein VYU27_006167 [Nannochloropsis oceanica]